MVRCSVPAAATPSLKPTVTVSAVKVDIDAALKRMAVLDGRKVAVAVQGSNVTLAGSVHNWDERGNVSKAFVGAQTLTGPLPTVPLQWPQFGLPSVHPPRSNP